MVTGGERVNNWIEISSVPLPAPDVCAGRPHGGASHAAIHRLVRQPVSVLVLMAQRMADLKGFEPRDALSGLVIERLEAGTFDLIGALNLADHQFGVGDHAQARMALRQRKREDGEQAGVLGEVIGLDAQKLAQFGQDAALGVMNDGAKAGGAGIATGAAIAMGCDPARFSVRGG
jgi:hypothetical protein